MPCRGDFQIYPGQYKSPTGMQMKGCPIRLKEMNNQRNTAPTRLVGAQVAMGNLIRRRVSATGAQNRCFGYKGEQCNPIIAYGPVFGLRQAPHFGSRCGDGGFRNIYYANHGDSSDVTMWKRLYGGSRQLFSTGSCEFGCAACQSYTCGRDNLRGRTSRACKTFNDPKYDGIKCAKDVYGVHGKNIKIGDVLWADNHTTPNFHEAVVLKVESHGADLVVGTAAVISTSRMNAHFGKSRRLVVYRRNSLNKWKLVGKAYPVLPAQS